MSERAEAADVGETSLAEVLRELRGVAGQVRDLRTILMGDGEKGETQYGRIPMLETRMGKAESCITELQTALVSARAYWDFARVAGHFLTDIVGGLVVALLRWWLLEGKH